MSAVTSKTLRLSMIDAFLYYLMVGIGETYLPAYVLSIGMNEVFAGILASLPLVSGAFLQLFTPKGLQKIGSHKSWVVGTAAVQALTFLPLIYFSTHHAPGFWTLFVILTFYWGANFAAGPAWNYWMGHLVPEKVASSYFSKRARISQVGLLIGVVTGGLFLHGKVELGPFSSVFGALFFVSFACRITSSCLLSAHHFKKEWATQHKLLGMRDSVKVFLNTGVKRKFFLYLLPLQIAVYISSPFVTPYLLAQVKLDYWSYMISTAAALIGKMMALAIIQYRQEDIDAFKLFGMGLIMVCFSPILWSFSSSFSYIVTLQVLAGMAWACFEVGLSLIFFRDLKQEEKVPILTVHNLLNAVGIITGTTIGGQLLTWLGTTKNSYLILFFFGGVMRFVFVFMLIKVLKNWQKSQAALKSKKAA